MKTRLMICIIMKLNGKGWRRELTWRIKFPECVSAACSNDSNRVAQEICLIRTVLAWLGLHSACECNLLQELAFLSWLILHGVNRQMGDLDTEISWMVGVGHKRTRQGIVLNKSTKNKQGSTLLEAPWRTRLTILQSRHVYYTVSLQSYAVQYAVGHAGGNPCICAFCLALAYLALVTQDKTLCVT